MQEPVSKLVFRCWQGRGAWVLALARGETLKRSAGEYDCVTVNNQHAHYLIKTTRQRVDGTGCRWPVVSSM